MQVISYRPTPEEHATGNTKYEPLAFVRLTVGRVAEEVTGSEKVVVFAGFHDFRALFAEKLIIIVRFPHNNNNYRGGDIIHGMPHYLQHYI